MIERNQRDAGAQTNARGARRCRHGHDWRGTERVAGVVVLAKPHRIKTQLLFELHLLENLIVVLRGRTMRLGVVVGGVENAEFHRAALLSHKLWHDLGAEQFELLLYLVER